jgi:phenol 2-monooxygenase (NADPH)
VRIDGAIETDMPDADEGLGSVESPTHGNVLFVRLDHGRTRVGFPLSPAMIAKYGEKLTQEDVIAEAKLAVKPFSLEFTCVDWFTTYAVRHLVADTYIKDRVILSGDACHSHSSGTAQGMNTGVQDAFNLAWKLAGVLKKWFHPSVLATYNSERRPVAQKIVTMDKVFSALISGIVPPELASISDDPHILFTKFASESVAYSTGLGVRYETTNPLNVATRAGMIPAGARAPDVLVFAPGSCLQLPTRLHSLMKNFGLFWIVVFAGEPLLTRPKLKILRSFVDQPDSAAIWAAPNAHPAPRDQRTNDHSPARVKFLTIIQGRKPAVDEALGVPRFGDAYYDYDSSAHSRYGVSSREGAVLVIRPDSTVGFATRLDHGREIVAYFKGFFL